MSDDDKISFDAELIGTGRATIEVDDKIRYSIPETFELNVTAHITADEIRRAIKQQSDHRYERAELQALFTSLNIMRDENDRLRSALDKIAAWDEGEEVTGSFDEPNAARIARDALSPKL